MNSDHCSQAFVSKPGNSTYTESVLLQDDGAAGPLDYLDGNTAEMQLAGSPPAAWCWVVHAVLMTQQPPKTKLWGSTIFSPAAWQLREGMRHSLIHSEAWSSAYWGRLIPVEGQSLCRVNCLAVPFCPPWLLCFSQWRANFAHTTDFAVLLCLLFLAFSFLTCP